MKESISRASLLRLFLGAVAPLLLTTETIAQETLADSCGTENQLALTSGYDLSPRICFIEWSSEENSTPGFLANRITSISTKTVLFNADQRLIGPDLVLLFDNFVMDRPLVVWAKQLSEWGDLRQLEESAEEEDRTVLLTARLEEQIANGNNLDSIGASEKPRHVCVI